MDVVFIILYVSNSIVSINRSSRVATPQPMDYPYYRLAIPTLMDARSEL